VEFLITFTITVPEGTPGQTVDDTKAREAQRAHELAEQGHLLRLWTPPAEPGQWRTLGLWRAQDAAEMQAILESLPCTSGRLWRPRRSPSTQTTRRSPRADDVCPHPSVCHQVPGTSPSRSAVAHSRHHSPASLPTRKVMSEKEQRVAIITGGSQGIGASQGQREVNRIGVTGSGEVAGGAGGANRPSGRAVPLGALVDLGRLEQQLYLQA
jgi:muconolactone D-isomerase